MDSKKIVQLTPETVQANTVLNKIKDDPLYTQSYPRAVLMLNASLKMNLHQNSKRGKEFGLKCSRHGVFHVFEAKESNSGSFAVDLLSLFGFLVSVSGQNDVSGAYLGIENTLHDQMACAARGEPHKRFRYILETEKLGADMQDFKIDGFGVQCLTDAGFHLAAADLAAGKKSPTKVVNQKVADPKIIELNLTAPKAVTGARTFTKAELKSLRDQFVKFATGAADATASTHLKIVKVG